MNSQPPLLATALLHQIVNKRLLPAGCILQFGPLRRRQSSRERICSRWRCTNIQLRTPLTIFLTYACHHHIQHPSMHRRPRGKHCLGCGLGGSVGMSEVRHQNHGFQTPSRVRRLCCRCHPSTSRAPRSLVCDSQPMPVIPILFPFSKAGHQLHQRTSQGCPRPLQ